MNLDYYIGLVLPDIISILEIIGIFVVVVSAAQAFGKYLANTFARKSYGFKLHLAEGLATALGFKMAAEILKTVLVRELNELLMVGAIIILRTLLSLLIQFEMRPRR